jgi:integrase/recombinase XerD
VKQRVSLREPDWPAADRAAWARALKPEGVLEDGGIGARWSSATRKHVRNGYGRWLAFLKATDEGVLDLAPAGRVTPDRVRQYLKDGCAGLASSSRWNYAYALYHALRAIAPDHDWGWLKDRVARLDRDIVPRDKRARMVEALRLIELGIRLMDTAANAPVPPHYARENQFRDGLIITFLGFRPIRRRNIAAIRLNKHLIQVGRTYRLVFSGEETKNKRPFEVQLPDLLVPYIDRYLQEIRPRFPRAGEHDGLWASEKGFPMDDGTIYDRVRLRTRKALGVAVNLHSIRDSAATFLADHDDEGLNNARDLLGHARLSTTERHYVHADRRKAVQAFQNSIEQLRQQYRRQPKRPRVLAGTNT